LTSTTGGGSGGSVMDGDTVAATVAAGGDTVVCATGVIVATVSAGFVGGEDSAALAIGTSVALCLFGVHGSVGAVTQPKKVSAKRIMVVRMITEGSYYVSRALVYYFEPKVKAVNDRNQGPSPRNLAFYVLIRHISKAFRSFLDS
jgi:hypothetical protein